MQMETKREKPGRISHIRHPLIFAFFVSLLCVRSLLGVDKNIVYEGEQ